MTKKMTINQAGGRMRKLEQEIQWLEPLVDEELADRLELGIEPTPPEIKDVLEKQLTKRRKELERLTAAVDMYLSATPFDFDVEGDE